MPRLFSCVVAIVVMSSVCGCAARPGVAAASPARDQAATPGSGYSRQQLQGILELLASDLFEGRGPGTRGGQLAEAYVQSLYKLWDLAPGPNQTYLQPFALKGYSAQELTVTVADTPFQRPGDVMGTFAVDEPEFQLTAEAVFVGFGITTPLFAWDDFKGVDVRGKLVVARVNDPGLFVQSLFEGKKLTYFGRWTYHVEEAKRRGAAGVLLIHSDETAGYGWNVVRSSWSAESLHLTDDANTTLKFRGWIREASLRRALESRGVDLEKLYRASLTREFKPVPLGFSISVRGRQQIRDLVVNNVVAEIPGQTAKRIVLSAHIDHLGRDERLSGDDIFNGAIDNASAVAAMLLTAKRLKERAPYYTITVLAAQAEEAGLLGARAYVASTDRDSIIASINFESTPVWERAGSIMGIGAAYSTLEDDLRAVAQQNGWRYAEFSMVDQGFFYRSDQFPFALHGIPSVWISAGEDDASGKRRFPAFWKTDYHTVRDEYHADWPLAGLDQTIRAAVDLVERLNRNRSVPRWKRTLTFPTVVAPERRRR